MSRFHFAKPSLKRLLVSTTVVAAVTCVVTGIALAVGYTHWLTDPAPVGDYIRLFITFVVLWGPTYLLFFWWATIPGLIGLGALVASVRRGDAPGGVAARRPDGLDGFVEPDDPRSAVENDS
jgi:hypothetical protein